MHFRPIGKALCYFIFYLEGVVSRYSPPRGRKMGTAWIQTANLCNVFKVPNFSQNFLFGKLVAPARKWGLQFRNNSPCVQRLVNCIICGGFSPFDRAKPSNVNHLQIFLITAFLETTNTCNISILMVWSWATEYCCCIDCTTPLSADMCVGRFPTSDLSYRSLCWYTG